MYKKAVCYVFGAFGWPWCAGVMVALGDWFTGAVLLAWSFVAWWTMIAWVRGRYVRPERVA